MDPRRVLLIEDNERVREVFAAYLEHDGWAVALATDGLEGLDAALADPPDLIVTDIMMPRLDGLEMLRRMRAEPALLEVPVLVVSAQGGLLNDLERLPGRLRYLTKPVSLSGFLGAVRQLSAPQA
ncbi:MAG: response regulator [Armatimonadetes bacterium]|nr:response regulator [Armatimonadota bacterium]